MEENTPQNGVAQRKNITIIEATKPMIHDQSLPMTLYAEVCMTTIYVQNRSPHQILKNITPEEAFVNIMVAAGGIYLHV
jgi:hypothetical protein